MKLNYSEGLKRLKGTILDHLAYRGNHYPLSYLKQLEENKVIRSTSREITNPALIKLKKRAKSIRQNKTTPRNDSEVYQMFLGRLKIRVEQSIDYSSLYQNLTNLYGNHSWLDLESGKVVFGSEDILLEILALYKKAALNDFSENYQFLWKPCLQLMTESEWLDFLEMQASKIPAERHRFSFLWEIYHNFLSDSRIPSSKISTETRSERLRLLSRLSHPGEIMIFPISRVSEVHLGRAITYYAARESIRKNLYSLCGINSIKPNVKTNFSETVLVFKSILPTKVLISNIQNFVKVHLAPAGSGNDHTHKDYSIELSNASEFILVVRTLFERTDFFLTEIRGEIKLWLEFILSRDQKTNHSKNIETYFDYEKVRQRNLLFKSNSIGERLKVMLPKSIDFLPEQNRRRRKKPKFN